MAHYLYTPSYHSIDLFCVVGCLKVYLEGSFQGSGMECRVSQNHTGYWCVGVVGICDSNWVLHRACRAHIGTQVRNRCTLLILIKWYALSALCGGLGEWNATSRDDIILKKQLASQNANRNIRIEEILMCATDVNQVWASSYFAPRNLCFCVV